VVTGAGSGIGRAIALKFAQHGAATRILDLNQKDAETVAEEIVTRTSAMSRARTKRTSTA